MPDLPTPDDDHDRKVLADVAGVGWHVMKVPELGRTPGWAFSIGLHRTFEHPELLVFGLPLDAMHRLINGLGESIREGARFAPGTTSADLVEGYTCSLTGVCRRWYEPFLGYACWFYQGADFPVVQVVWPDRSGCLPEDPSFDAELAPLQPLLCYDDVRQARAEQILHTLDA